MTDSTTHATPARVAVHFFDGRSSRAQAAWLSAQGTQALVHDDNGALLASAAFTAVQWPERTRYGARTAHWPHGQSLQAINHEAGQQAWDAWTAAHVRSDSLVVRAQQSWRWVAVSMVLVVLASVAGYIWGLPVVARGVVSLVPSSIDDALGRQSMAQIDGQWMAPSQLPPETQERLRARFDKAARQTLGAALPAYRLEFRRSKIGPNAFALPGGTLVMTDELVELVKDEDVVMGVLGHELGHVSQRHGMRQLVQLGLLQAALGVVFGDYGSWLATAPLVLGTMGYSREHEREADRAAVQFLHATGISPLVMVKFFQAVRSEQAKKKESKDSSKALSLGIAIISSHPADEERIFVFEQAARTRH